MPKELTADDIRPIDAVYEEVPHDLCINLAPIDDESTQVTTSIRLDRIDLPFDDLLSLQEQTFTFPVNSVDDYIKGTTTP